MKTLGLALMILLQLAISPKLFSQTVAINCIGTMSCSGAMPDVSSNIKGFLETITLNLPTPGTTGPIYIIKKISGSTGTFDATIHPNSSQTIAGASTKAISTVNSIVIMQSDGAKLGTDKVKQEYYFKI